MEHHWVRLVLIASCLVVPGYVLDDRMLDEYNYDDELDFVLLLASSSIEEI
jgi:hypothetical protein